MSPSLQGPGRQLPQGAVGLCLGRRQEFQEDAGAGRILVYCRTCQVDMAGQLGETIPLGKVSSGVFLDLYRTGKTTSDPFTACELVFGSVKPDLVREAQTLMNHIDRQ